VDAAEECEEFESACFDRDDDQLVPTRAARSGWSDDTIMGRYVACTVAWAAEQHAGAEWQPARLTVDMFRPAPLAPLDVATTVVRDGRRLRVLDTEIRVDGVLVSRGTVVFARRSEEGPVEVWNPPDWAVPAPDALARRFENFGFAMPWDQRTIAEPSPEHPHRVWLRETVGFLPGAPLSPFMRVAMAADHSNGQINTGPRGVGHINADLTLTLARLPRGEWIGLDTTSRASADGVSVGTVDVYDLEGRVGHVSMVGLVDGRVLRDA
jgi:hypothetical protein